MLDALRRWRNRRTLTRRPIPDALWLATLARFPFLTRLDVDDGQQLREMSTLFLDRKEFNGAHDLVITDDMAVAIAAQACLPILRLGLEWYDSFVGIVVHADEVVARREVMDEDGVVHHYDEPLSGEAMEGGPVTLSWQDVADAGNSAEWGYNVVIHEFAHVLDMRDGEANGMPALPSRSAQLEWKTIFEANYDSFCARVEAGEDTLLDPYGAEAPSEFFAVACEAFFVAPHDLQAEHPQVYAQLQQFFQQDPALRA
ncbi:MAG: zinc-dependent peptidase [Rhizobacter sp.]|nr:zinc-dependent peptidase [Rhizobacter sp.]